MKEHPIIFSTPMVQAILEGRKSQTRRILKHQPITKVSKWVRENGDVMWYYGAEHTLNCTVACPYGKPGDILWVRESFFDCSAFKHAPLFSEVEGNIIYKADTDFIGCHKWKPSIHMPRTAARIFLQIENIRVERLKYITEDGARKEGMTMAGSQHSFVRAEFQTLWNKLNGKRAPWKSNPWVWVIEFARR